MLREVRLYGHLAKRFGRVHRFDVASAAEAVAALRANFRDFDGHVLAHNLPGYRVLAGRQRLDRDHLSMQIGGQQPIRIVPVIAGAKRAGIGQIIVGALLIVAGVAITYFSGGSGAGIGKALVVAGVASIIGGVVSLLTPLPKGPKERPENEPSYFFDGPVNTTAQGQPVPVLFGRLIVGSAVISSGISAEDIAGPAAPPAPPPQSLPPEEDIPSWELPRNDN